MTEKGRRDTDDELEQHDYAMLVVNPGETWLFNYQADPKALYEYTDTDGAAEELTRKSVSCTVDRHGGHNLGCSDARQSRNARSSREAESHGIVRRLPGVASS